MFILNKQSLDFDEKDLPLFVDAVSHQQYGKKVIFNDRIASGHYKLIQFPNGMYAYVSNYVMNDDFELDLAVDKNDYLALHINQIQAGPEFSMLLNNKSVSYDDKIVTSLFLTGCKDSFILNGSKGACFNRLKIVFPKAWALKNVRFFNEDLLGAYLGLKEERFFLDSLNTTYRNMVDQVMNIEDSGFQLAATQNTIVSITEYFFDRLHKRINEKDSEHEKTGQVA